MKQQNTHYHVLGLKPDVKSGEIKRAYRQLVKDYHPDLGHNGHDSEAKKQATEYMMRLNEAYETLMDQGKRLAYDTTIGIRRLSRSINYTPDAFSEDAARERYLRTVFHPCRQEISRVLNLYQGELRKLSLDIFDDELVAAFAEYISEVDTVLRDSAEAFAGGDGPRSLQPAVQMMRYAISQAVDGLEEMNRFCQNYDYDHLAMAETLFRIALDLSKEALRLARV